MSSSAAPADEAAELEALGITLVDEISWDEADILRPGMDFKQGVAFVTLPATIQVEKVVGRGKAAKTVIEGRRGLAVVASDHRDSFPFTKAQVEALGYVFPEHIVLPDERRWSKAGVEEFTSKRDAAPFPPDLLAAVRKVYEQYIEFSRPEYYDVMALFVMGTYVFRLFQSLGYIHFNGTAASGKSQNLALLKALAFNPQWASSMSSAALYRSLAGHPGTVCIDEAEGFDGERGEELRRILNAGYLDGATVKRVEKGADDNFQVASFESYGPKAIASINPLDAVIGSRCLVVTMRPTIRRFPEFDSTSEKWQSIRDRLYLWLMHHSKAIAEHIEAWNKTIRNERAPNLISRQWQITQMYVIIADYIDGFDKGTRCDTLIKFFYEYFSEQQKQLDASDRIRLLLRCLPRVLATQQPAEGGWYALKTIHEVVSQYLEEDQKEYYKTRTVGKALDTLGFKRRRAHKQGQQVWLDPAQVRQEFLQRRVEPDPEDEAWLRGEVEYEPQAYEPPPSEYARTESVWDTLEEPL